MLCARKTDSIKTSNSGFTVIELLIVIAVVAVMLSWAMPNLQGTLARNQLLGQANELATAMSTARSEAVTRGTQAGVCPSADGSTCGDSDDWGEGDGDVKFILVFVDQDAGPGTNVVVLKSFATHPKVKMTPSANVASYLFNSTGFAPGFNSAVQMCHPDLDISDRCRTVTIAPTGIISVRPSTASS